MIGPNTRTLTITSVRVNIIVTERTGKFLRACSLQTFCTLCTPFVLVTSKNQNFYTLLEMIGLAILTLSLVCPNFSVIIQTEKTNQENKTHMPPPLKASLITPFKPAQAAEPGLLLSVTLNEREKVFSHPHN